MTPLRTRHPVGGLTRPGVLAVNSRAFPEEGRTQSGVLFSWGQDNADEEDVPAEQSEAQEDSRFSGTYAEQGRSSRPQAASAARAQAHRGLRASELAVSPAGWPRGLDGLSAARAAAERLRVQACLRARYPPRRSALPDGGGRERAGLQPARPRGESAGRRGGDPQPGAPPPSRGLSTQPVHGGTGLRSRSRATSGNEWKYPGRGGT